MSSAFSARRRAERFDALVGDPATGADDARSAELLELVGALRSVPAPTPRPAFSASLREQLMTEADTVLLPRDRSVDARLALPATTRAPRSRRDRRLAVAAGTLAVVGASTSMAMAAQTALPGEALYPVKRALEDAHAEVSVGDGAKGSTLLANASGRLDELVELARLDTPESTAAVPGTLDAFTEQAEEASQLLLEDYTETGDAGSISELRDFTAGSMADLARLESLLPPSAHDSLRSAAELLAEIDATAARLCPTCGGSGITEVPLALLGAASSSLEELAAPAPPRSVGGTVIGIRNPGRPISQQPPTAPGEPEVRGTDGEIRSPGSVFVPPSGGGREGDGAGGSDDDGLRDLLTGGGRSTGASTDGGLLDPVTEPLEPLLDPVVDPLTGLVDDALGGS